MKHMGEGLGLLAIAGPKHPAGKPSNRDAPRSPRTFGQEP